MSIYLWYFIFKPFFLSFVIEFLTSSVAVVFSVIHFFFKQDSQSQKKRQTSTIVLTGLALVQHHLPPLLGLLELGLPLAGLLKAVAPIEPRALDAARRAKVRQLTAGSPEAELTAATPAGGGGHSRQFQGALGAGAGRGGCVEPLEGRPLRRHRHRFSRGAAAAAAVADGIAVAGHRPEQPRLRELGRGLGHRDVRVDHAARAGARA